MSDILHQITINAPTDKVYAALSTVDGLAGWWTSTTKGESAPGKTLEFPVRRQRHQDARRRAG